MEILAQHLIHISVVTAVALGMGLRRVRLPQAWLGAFVALVVIHWGEHVAQLLQIYALGWARPQAGGFLGLIFPLLNTREWLHTGFSVIVLAGLLGFQHGFTGMARTVWTVALGIQLFHVFEHQMLFWQATLGVTLWGAKAPVSLVQAMLPAGLRPELHLVYNLLVTAPMVAAQVLQVVGGGLDSFLTFYHWGRERGHPVLLCLQLAYRQAKQAAQWRRSAMARWSWDTASVMAVARKVFGTWRRAQPSGALAFLEKVDGVVDTEAEAPNFTILSSWVEHDVTKDRRPVRLTLIPTGRLLDMLEGLGAQTFTAAFAAIVGHELAHVGLSIRHEDRGAWAGPEGNGDTPRVEGNEVDADLEGVRLAEEAGFSQARGAALLALQAMDRMYGFSPERQRRMVALGLPS